jgi:hypothetical protein
MAGCTWVWGGPPQPGPNGSCARPVGLAITDLTLGAGSAITGLVAAYPCVIDVDGQSEDVRALHCGIAAAGVAIGAVFVASGARGVADARECRRQHAGTERN